MKGGLSMNNLEYKILNYCYEKSNRQRVNIYEFCEEQYNYLNDLSKKFVQEEIELTPEEFEAIITQIYEVLKLSIREEGCSLVITHYIVQLAADCAYEKINLAWCLDKLYYLATYMDKNVTRKYADDILYIQEQLYKKFQIQEDYFGYLNRKAKIKTLSRVGKTHNRKEKN